jgi:nitrogen fixation NifU-like protein
MPYSNKVIEHFKNPHNQGTIPDADAIGEEGNPICGDVMKIYLKIKPSHSSSPEYIEDIKFETLGCAAAIAVSSALTDLAKGKTLDEAMKITKDTIVDDLGGLPMQKVHCSMLGVDALRQAINNFRSKK